mmetsp:Transcript_48696/g.155633  ORF Transcript_48696/g.155633 Transcript_48696/m.155633 type:complete len:441 (-) Transcript_48696:842-2164(-)
MAAELRYGLHTYGTDRPWAGVRQGLERLAHTAQAAEHDHGLLQEFRVAGVGMVHQGLGRYGIRAALAQGHGQGLARLLQGLLGSATPAWLEERVEGVAGVSHDMWAARVAACRGEDRRDGLGRRVTQRRQRHEQPDAVAAAALERRVGKVALHRFGEQPQDTRDPLLGAALGVLQDPVALEIVVKDVNDRAESRVDCLCGPEVQPQLAADEGQPGERSCGPEGVLQQPPVRTPAADALGKDLLGAASPEVLVPRGLDEHEPAQGLQRHLRDVDVNILAEVLGLELHEPHDRVVELRQLPGLRVRRHADDGAADGRDALLAAPHVRGGRRDLLQERQERLKCPRQARQLARRGCLARELGHCVQATADGRLRGRRLGHALEHGADAREVPHSPYGRLLVLATLPSDAALRQRLHGAVLPQRLRLHSAAPGERREGTHAGLD